MKNLLIISIVLLLSSGAFAQIGEVTKSGTAAASFLEIGVGSRAVGMGGAFVAIASDASAMYWNPAGISRIGKVEVIGYHTDWIADTDFDYAGIVMPVGPSGAFGMHFTALNMGEMKVRTIFYPEGTGEMFDASDIAFGITYAHNFTDRYSFGVNAKYIQQKIWHMSASAVAIDFGSLFNTGFHGLRLGMSISNFGNKLRLEGRDTAFPYDIDDEKAGNNDKIMAHLDTDKWPLPLTFRVGVAFEVIETEFNRLSIVTDAMHPNNNPESISIGAEYAMNEMIFLRGGYQSMFLDENEEGLTFGAGMSQTISGAWGLKIDYAWSEFGVFNPLHRFTLGLTF